MKSKIKILAKFLSKENSKPRPIPINKILRGAEGDDLSGLQYVLLTGDVFRTSTRVINGPQFDLLNKYSEIGDKLFKEDIFNTTAYYKNALESICYVGDYFPEARSPENIINVAKRFIFSFLDKDISNFSSIGHNKFNEPIVVRPIYKSNTYQIVSGNHRVASLYYKGFVNVDAIVLDEVTHTYFTDAVSKVVWDNGLALYQPIELPEFENYFLIRKCTDRLIKISNFLESINYKKDNKTLIDIGSYYGWFIHQFNKMRFDCYALEKDFSACEVSKKLYNIEQNRILNYPVETYLQNEGMKFNITLFMSVLHHFVMGKSFMSAEQIFKRLSEITIDIMFFETGEEHEKMFNGKLSGWNEDTIEEFILSNSNFKKIIRLGRDSDNVGAHKYDYQRMLFALIK